MTGNKQAGEVKCSMQKMNTKNSFINLRADCYTVTVMHQQGNNADVQDFALYPAPAGSVQVSEQSAGNLSPFQDNRCPHHRRASLH